MEINVTIGLDAKAQDLISRLIDAVDLFVKTETVGEGLPAFALKPEGDRPKDHAPASDEAAKGEAAEEKPSIPDGSSMAITLDQVVEAVKKSGLKRDEILEILSKYNVDKISAIPADKLADFLTDLGCY